MRTGITDAPLTWGSCPHWLFQRMVRLSRAIGIAIIKKFGPEEFLKRVSDPVWFQSFGCVIAFDWNASGLTTTTLGALKLALKGLEKDLGLFICGGKGKTSRKTPTEINNWGRQLRLNEKTIKQLEYFSKTSAKVDSALVQDGFQIYHHNFLFTPSGHWAVIQQGMNPDQKRARRYHWLGDQKKDLIEKPHAGIASQIFLPSVLDLTSEKSRENRKTSLNLIQSPKIFIQDIKILTVKTKSLNFKALSLPEADFYRHPVEKESFSLNPQIKKAIDKAIIAQPASFENLLMTKGVGEKTIRAISLVAEIIYGARPSYQDPARYTFAHGGKDGIPYPVDRKTYDQTLAVIEKAIHQERSLGLKEKSNALWRAEKTFFRKKPLVYN